MKVLAIEDQPIAALQLGAALRKLGHEPVAAGGGAEGWARLGREPLRIVVSDWRMPGIDGLELCRLIRKRGGDYIYFILISAAGVTPEGREAALAAGVDDFIAKPIDPDELKMRLFVAERILGFTQQVKKLESFLPICSYCRKIRDDQQYWKQVETYFGERDGTRFSHGICPACYDRVIVPELEQLAAEAIPRTEPPPAT
jgi:sigma-B regulation protein RsbU (phosphoserine phosphatase)